MMKKNIWYVYHNKFWMIQFAIDGWISFGIHLDFKRRKDAKSGQRYGPFAEIHFLFFIFSIGINPYFGTYN